MSVIAEVEVEIEAPVEAVWATMVDFAAYGDWNPFIVAVHGVQGPVGVGSTMTLEVCWPEGGGAKSGEEITVMTAPTQGEAGVLAYRFRSWLHTLGLVRAERVQRVESLGPGRTRYWTQEVFGGLLAGSIPLAKVQAGFEVHAQALRSACEGQAR